MEKQAKISIITPSYNQVQYIEEAITSVLDQGYPNLEYIIIDGGSTDGTVEIIKKYEEYLSYWVSEKDKGMYNALNKGFSRTTGEIMGWINADDMLHRNSLFVLSEIFEEFKAVEWITGFPTNYDHFGRVYPSDNITDWNIYSYLTGKIRSIQQESTFWRRSLWDKSGGYLDENYKYAADYELWARFFLYSKLYFVKAMVGGFRKHGEQISVDKKQKYIAECEQIRKQYRKKLKIIDYIKYSPMINNKLGRKIFNDKRTLVYDYKKAKFKLR